MVITAKNLFTCIIIALLKTRQPVYMQIPSHHNIKMRKPAIILYLIIQYFLMPCTNISVVDQYFLSSIYFSVSNRAVMCINFPPTILFAAFPS